jgi:xanthine dehydrogenase YagR molybdenum-binding subunit
MAPESKPREESAWTPRAQMTVLNKDQRRLDGPVKVTGRAVYPHDVRLPNMVYARLVVYPYSRATIKKVDVAPALAVPGVVYAALESDGKTDVRYQGADGVLAVVAGETPEAAEDGARAVVVEAEELPPVVTPEQAAADDAPQLSAGTPNVGSYRGRGDEEPALVAAEGADARVEATYSVPVQHHVCLETHGSVVDYQGGHAVVYPSTQYVSGAPGAFAGLLGLEAGNVRALCQHMGGGFGSKFGPGTEDRMACKVALALKRPVHLLLTRPQEFLMAGNRSGGKQHIVAGASKDGKLVAMSVTADKYGGMGGGSLPSLPYIYDVETSHFTARSVRTATDANRAMRAPGHPQASFAMESIVDELAYAVGVDPLEFRKQNLADPVYHRQLDRVAAELGWADHPHKSTPGPNDGSVREGIGFGVAQWGSGATGSRAEVRIAPDGSVTSSSATQDLGTGSRTYVAGIVAEEFGLPLERVTARIGDSDLPPSAASGGSVTTGSLAPAVKDAAHKAREALEAKLVATLGGDVGSFVWKDGKVTAADGGSLTFEQACATLGTEPLVAQGEFQRHLHEPRVHGAQGARVSVDTLTGEVKVLKMVGIQDQGIPLNRAALRSQINGGMVQALSYALLEARVHDADFGLMLTSNLEDYKIAGTLEMPEIVAIIDDDDTRQKVMGMAEATCIPGHGAIANAVFNACGARVRDLPLTPDKVLAALGRS